MRLFFFILISGLLFFSCQKGGDIINENLAEIREYYYEGECDEFDVSLVCGYREKDYVLNGYVTEQIEFGVLTFVMDDVSKYNIDNMKYVLIIGTNRYDGVLEKNPFDNSLVADIKKRVNVDKGVSAKIMLGEFVKEVKLKRIDSEWKISSTDLKDIIYKNYKNEIKSLIENDSFQGEIYIRAINDKDEYADDYYWYVSIISRKGGKLNALISIDNGEILLQKNTLDKF